MLKLILYLILQTSIWCTIKGDESVLFFNSNVKLTCQLSNYNNDLKWQRIKNDEEIELSNDERIEIDGRTLTIKNINQEDSGLYECYYIDDDFITKSHRILLDENKFPKNIQKDETTTEDIQVTSSLSLTNDQYDFENIESSTSIEELKQKETTTEYIQITSTFSTNTEGQTQEKENLEEQEKIIDYHGEVLTSYTSTDENKVDETLYSNDIELTRSFSTIYSSTVSQSFTQEQETTFELENENVITENSEATTSFSTFSENIELNLLTEEQELEQNETVIHDKEVTSKFSTISNRLELELEKENKEGETTTLSTFSKMEKLDSSTEEQKLEELEEDEQEPEQDTTTKDIELITSTFSTIYSSTVSESSFTEDQEIDVEYGEETEDATTLTTQKIESSLSTQELENEIIEYTEEQTLEEDEQEPEEETTTTENIELNLSTEEQELEQNETVIHDKDVTISSSTISTEENYVTFEVYKETSEHDQIIISSTTSSISMSSDDSDHAYETEADETTASTTISQQKIFYSNINDLALIEYKLETDYSNLYWRKPGILIDDFFNMSFCLEALNSSNISSLYSFECLNLNLDRVHFYQNRLIIYPVISSDFGHYELFSIENNEYSFIESIRLVESNKTNEYEISDDTIEIISTFSKYYKSGSIYWRKLNGNETSFDLDYYSRSINLENLNPNEIESAWKKLLGLDETRMNINKGRLRVSFFNQNDYGSYECVFFVRIKDVIYNASQTISITSEKISVNKTDKYIYLYGDFDANEYEQVYNGNALLGDQAELKSNLSHEFNNGFVIWRRVLSNDSFYINSFFEIFLQNYEPNQSFINNSKILELLELDVERMYIENGKLVINSFNQDDIGTYQCIFIYETDSNQNYKIKSNGKNYRYLVRTISIKLYFAEKEIKETITTEANFGFTQAAISSIITSATIGENITKIDAKTGKTIALWCNFNETIEIKWRKIIYGREPIELKCSRQEGTTSELELRNLILEHNGIYECYSLVNLTITNKFRFYLNVTEETDSLISSSYSTTSTIISTTSSPTQFTYSINTNLIQSENHYFQQYYIGEKVELESEMTHKYLTEKTGFVFWRRMSVDFDFISFLTRYRKLKDDSELSYENKTKIWMIVLDLDYDRMYISNGKLVIKSAKELDNGEFESIYISDIEKDIFESRIVRLMVNQTETVTATATETVIETSTSETTKMVIEKEREQEDEKETDKETERILCHPNEYKCADGKCYGKMWKCDGENDCEDGSDEVDCDFSTLPDSNCKSFEFECRNRSQCIKKSYVCDQNYDCEDLSDEENCTAPFIVMEPNENITVSVGKSFTLSCEAFGNPDPFINWRLNWSHVCEKPRCLMNNTEGLGYFTVLKASLLDSGFYICEAINSIGRVYSSSTLVTVIPTNETESEESTNYYEKIEISTKTLVLDELSTTIAEDFNSEKDIYLNETTYYSSTKSTIETTYTEESTISNELSTTVYEEFDSEEIDDSYDLSTTTIDNSIEPDYSSTESPTRTTYTFQTSRTLDHGKEKLNSSCDCNGHSLYCNCDGICSNCLHNTFGDHCEKCSESYIGDATKGTPFDCVPIESKYQEHEFSCYCSGLSVNCAPSKSHYRKVISFYDEEDWQITNKYFQLREKVKSNKYGVYFDEFSKYMNEKLYFILPPHFFGSRVLFYNGKLTFNLKFETSQYVQNIEQLEIRISGAKLNLIHVYSKDLLPNVDNMISVNINELNFKRYSDNSFVERQVFLHALSDIHHILIKAKLIKEQTKASITDFSIEYADSPYSDTGEEASSIEVCNCPQGYTGTSCESCAQNYRHIKNGRYDATCEAIN